MSVNVVRPPQDCGKGMSAVKVHTGLTNMTASNTGRKYQNHIANQLEPWIIKTMQGLHMHAGSQMESN